MRLNRCLRNNIYIYIYKNIEAETGVAQDKDVINKERRPRVKGERQLGAVQREVEYPQSGLQACLVH